MLLPKTVWARGTRWTWPQDLPTLKGQQPDNDSNSKNRQRQLVSGRTGKPNFSEKLGVSITNKWRIGAFYLLLEHLEIWSYLEGNAELWESIEDTLKMILLENCQPGEQNQVHCRDSWTSSGSTFITRLPTKLGNVSNGRGRDSHP